MGHILRSQLHFGTWGKPISPIAAVHLVCSLSHKPTNEITSVEFPNNPQNGIILLRLKLNRYYHLI